MSAIAAEAARDFTFIRPRKRRLTEYEAVTVHQQPEPGGFDPAGWYLLTPEGRPAWKSDSTRLDHSDWFAFRDPAALWQRTYVRLQAEQERSIERASEDAAESGLLAAMDPDWLNRVVAGPYRMWSFFEYALFRAFAPASREALSDTLGNALCFQGFDHMRHAQAIVLHLLVIETARTDFQDRNAKARWLTEPAWQPLRRLAEQLIATEDWAELAVAVNLAVAPILSRLVVGGLVGRGAALHGDPVSALIAMTAERDRRRNQACGVELVRMVMAEDLPSRAQNRSVLEEWIATWTRRAREAAESLAPVFAAAPAPIPAFDAFYAEALADRAKLLADLGLAGGGQAA